jgi:chromosome condensin MukBEF MukE localization factor
MAPWGIPASSRRGFHRTRQVNLTDDALLSNRHASLSNLEGKLFLRDFGSQNGTFIKQRQDSEFVPRDIFLSGREIFRPSETLRFFVLSH